MLDNALFFPEVLQAVNIKGYTIHAYMNDGTIKAYDAEPLIKRGGVFEKIKDPEIFKNTLTVMNGTAAFDITGDRNPETCIDIDPITIYESPDAIE